MVFRGLPRFSELKHIFLSEDVAVQLLIETGVIREHFECSCGYICEVNLERRQYRCFSRHCRMNVSIFKRCFFYKSCLKINEILHLSFVWLCGAPNDFALSYFGYSSHTVAAYFYYFRQLVADSLEEIDFKIGGEGVVVEIDESKFGKRKYEHGHPVEGVWILGGVERTEERKVFLVQVPDRTADTLQRFIESHVYEGSIIYSDLWKGYLGLSERMNVQHYTVNHSENFVDSDTGAHTNTIEGTWSGVKRKIPVRKRTKSYIDDHLLEFVWRRKHSHELWPAFFAALKDVDYMN